MSDHGGAVRSGLMGYTEAKNDLILDLLAEAEQWAAARGWAPPGESRRP